VCLFLAAIKCQIPQDKSQDVMSCDPRDHFGECPDMEVSVRCSCDGKTPIIPPTIGASTPSPNVSPSKSTVPMPKTTITVIAGETTIVSG